MKMLRVAVLSPAKKAPETISAIPQSTAKAMTRRGTLANEPAPEAGKPRFLPAQLAISVIKISLIQSFYIAETLNGQSRPMRLGKLLGMA
jgi:hypothetical protein